MQNTVENVTKTKTRLNGEKVEFEGVKITTKDENSSSSISFFGDGEIILGVTAVDGKIKLKGESQ